MSAIKRKLYLGLIEHPKLVFSQVLKGLKWQDGNVYEDHQNTHVYIFPADIFPEIRIELRNTVGKKLARNLLYNLNQLGADVVIKDAIDQEFKGKDLFKYFCAVMSLFGWGFAEHFDFDPSTGAGVVIIARFPQSSTTQTEPVHDDFAGIIARALELTYEKKYEVRETKCCEMTGTRPECTYQITPLKEGMQALGSKIDVKHFAKIDAKSIVNPEDFDKLMDQMAMPENGVLMLGEKDAAKRVVIKDVESINSMFLKTADLLGWKTMGPVLFRVGRNHVLKDVGSKNRMYLDDIKKYLYKLTLFGWGIFEVKQTGEGTYQVVLTKNPFTAGFPVQQFATDYLIGGFLSGMFEALAGKRVNVKEIECSAKGDSRCLFEVSVPVAKQ
ncbi:MAG: V4R domain-containing protein [Candidatus Sigynarchaeota archaeon]